jgi:cyclopropane fatty-acyl-phospholipid synthase-like methyltransferase
VPGEAAVALEPLRFDCDDGRFDLVLAWEAADFVPPERLHEFGQEIRRVLRDGGQVVLFCHQKPAAEFEALPRYRMIADDLVVRETSPGAAHRRWAHPTREIERALTGLSVQGIHLQRSQMREIVAVKPGVG